jgi:hypothetical protein
VENECRLLIYRQEDDDAKVSKFPMGVNRKIAEYSYLCTPGKKFQK